jgi:transposase
MPAPRKYPNGLRERAQRLVDEAREQDQTLSLNATVLRIGPRVGVNPDTLRGWCKQGDIDERLAGTCDPHCESFFGAVDGGTGTWQTMCL